MVKAFGVLILLKEYILHELSNFLSMAEITQLLMIFNTDYSKWTITPPPFALITMVRC